MSGADRKAPSGSKATIQSFKKFLKTCNKNKNNGPGNNDIKIPKGFRVLEVQIYHGMGKKLDKNQFNAHFSKTYTRTTINDQVFNRHHPSEVKRLFTFLKDHNYKLFEDSYYSTFSCFKFRYIPKVILSNFDEAVSFE